MESIFGTDFNFDYKPVLLFGIILILTFFIARWFDRFFKHFVLDSSRVLENDPTNYQFIRHFVIASIYLFGLMMAINVVPSLRVLSTSLLAGAGIFAVAIGFASQQAFSNIVSGLFLIIFKPFRVNQVISIGSEVSGTVEDITLRHTVVRDLQNKRIIIPNSNVSDAIITNSTAVDEKVCRFFEVGVSYDTDLDKAMKVIAEEAEKHPLTLDKRTEQEKLDGVPIVACKILTLGDSAITIRAWIWAKSFSDAFTIHCEMNKTIVERFRKDKISIPYPRKEIIIKSE